MCGDRHGARCYMHPPRVATSSFVAATDPPPLASHVEKAYPMPQWGGQAFSVFWLEIWRFVAETIA